MKTLMMYSQSGMHLTEGFEGCKLKAYPDDGGVWTIGYGHTFKVIEGMTCTQQEAEDWLRQDVKRAESACNYLVQIDLSQNEFDALVDFVFNCGISAFRDSTLLRLLNQKMYWQAADEFLKWDKCKGHILAGLLLRRKAEQQKFRTE